MRSTPSVRFSTPPGAGGRLPPDGLAEGFSAGVGQPEDVASPDCEPVPGKVIPFVATDQEISHGRGITWTLRAKEAPKHISESWVGTSWIVEMTATGTRDGRAFQAQHLFLTSLRTTPEALLRLVRDRWSIECWHSGSVTSSSTRTPTATGVMALVRWPACELQHSICCGWADFSRFAPACRR